MNSDATYPQDTHEITEDPLYVMTVELEKGKSESIRIYSDSKPEELAYEFCKKNNLDFVSLEYLTNQIKSLFITVSNTNHLLMQNNNNQNQDQLQEQQQECIIEEEEDDNLYNEQRQMNAKSHYINFLPDEKDNTALPIETNYFNQCTNEENKNTDRNQWEDNKREGEEEVDDMESNQSNSNKDIIRNSQLDSNSLFSYNEFYNRLKVKFKERELQYYSSKSNPTDSKYVSKCSGGTTIPLLKEATHSSELLSIAYNERKYNEFLQQFDGLDEIYQNKHYEKRICSTLNSNHQFTTNTISYTHDGYSNSKVIGDSLHLQSNQPVLISKPQSNVSHTNANIHNKAKTDSYVYSDSNLNFNGFKSMEYQSNNRTISFNQSIKLNEPGLHFRERNNLKSRQTAQTVYNNPLSSMNINARSRTITYTHRNNNTIRNATLYYKRNLKATQGNCDSYSNKYKTMNRVSNSKRITNKAILQFKHKGIHTGSNEENKENAVIDVVFNKKKQEIFKKIFHLLDSNKDKRITIITMDTSRIPSTIYNIIKPLIFEIKQSDSEEIDEGQFITGFMSLFEGLPFNNRRALLDFSTKIRYN